MPRTEADVERTENLAIRIKFFVIKERLQMAQRHQQGWLKREKRSRGETWVLFFRTVRKSDGKRVENKIPIALVKDFPDKSCA
jgi:hypothetical protein